MKDYARVVPHLREAIRIRPDNDQTYVYLGDTLNNLKQFKDATQAYQSAIELEPRNPMPYLSLADTLNNANDVVGAAANYQKALDLSPSMPEALIGLQQSRRDLADWTDWDELWYKLRSKSSRCLLCLFFHREFCLIFCLTLVSSNLKLGKRSSNRSEASSRRAALAPFPRTAPFFIRSS